MEHAPNRIRRPSGTYLAWVKRSIDHIIGRLGRNQQPNTARGSGKSPGDGFAADCKHHHTVLCSYGALGVSDQTSGFADISHPFRQIAWTRAPPRAEDFATVTQS